MNIDSNLKILNEKNHNSTRFWYVTPSYSNKCSSILHLSLCLDKLRIISLLLWSSELMRVRASNCFSFCILTFAFTKLSSTISWPHSRSLLASNQFDSRCFFALMQSIFPSLISSAKYFSVSE